MSHEVDGLEPFQSGEGCWTRSGSGSDDSGSVSALGGHGVYEIKFLVTETQSCAVQEWARIHLQHDPHASAENGYGYSVNSLYLDTPGFDVFHRAETFRQRKFRLRRYGCEDVIWMELKSKSTGRVNKRRTPIAAAHLQGKIISGEDSNWDGNWFRAHVDGLGLRPVCQVTYQRFACVGTSIFGPIRLTMDSQLRCQPANGWTVPSEPLASGALLQDRQILELKFCDTIPNLFRDLIRDLHLNIATFSKYRQSVEASIAFNRLLAGLNSAGG